MQSELYDQYARVDQRFLSQSILGCLTSGVNRLVTQGGGWDDGIR